MTVQDFVREQGTDEPITLTIKDSDGNAQDITGWTIRLTLKDYPSDTDANAVLQEDAVITNASGGLAQFNLSDSDTDSLEGTYYYDIRYKDSGGDIKVIYSGKFMFHKRVTNSMS